MTARDIELAAPAPPPAAVPADRDDQAEFLGEGLAHERSRLRGALRYSRKNPALALGALLLGSLAAFTAWGYLFYPIDMVDPLSGIPSRPPSARHPFGTDPQGRDILAVMITGTWLTLSAGLLAAVIGTAVGAALGFVAGYVGGWVDAAINWTVDVLLTIPAILILVVIATSIGGRMSLIEMALIIAMLAWRRPTRQVRSQVLVMRNAGYVRTAQLSGMGNAGIIFRELMPNLIPYLIAAFVLATSAAIMASVGLQAMGLGPMHEPTLGQTIYWLINSSAFLLGMWWWIVPPILVLVIVFVGFYFISAGLDEFANPRLRERA